jgi:hypothetical protein
MTGDPFPNPHADDSMVGPHGSAEDHGESHGHDDHAHPGATTLGPLDRAAWGAGFFGLLLGLTVALALAMSSGYRPF